MTQKMSRVGRCIDNDSTEGFLDILKCEMYYLKHFESYEELVTAVRQFIHYSTPGDADIGRIANHRPATAGCRKPHNRKPGLLSRNPGKNVLVFLLVYLTGAVQFGDSPDGLFNLAYCSEDSSSVVSVVSAASSAVSSSVSAASSSLMRSVMRTISAEAMRASQAA